MKFYLSIAALVALAACEASPGMSSGTSLTDGPKDYAAMSLLYPDLSITQFDQLDTNQDGVIDDAEMSGLSQFAPRNQDGIIDSSISQAATAPISN